MRRELWENRAVYLAPTLVGAVVVIGCVIWAFVLPARLRAAGADPAQQEAILVGPYAGAPAAVMLTTFLVGFFYCIDALYRDRRDGTILFWKSQPVSDRTAVLAKAAIPLAVLPLIGFALGWVTQLAVLLLTTVSLVAGGFGAGLLWGSVPLLQQPLVMLYGMAVHALWFAPIYGWLLVVSAWARRAPLVWAVVPPLAAAAFEFVTSGTRHVGTSLRHRMTGAVPEAFTVVDDAPILRLAQLDPARFLASTDVWVGGLVAALFLLACVKLRQRAGPL
ncbi:MAG: ABC transporter permease [Thermoanaerobaculia bacterium]|nr:ABC transporter permease [Thermoanaerobaculia bacterium]